jgi:hypothetical protein
MAFEVGCHKQGYGDQWPRPKIVAPRFIFQSTNEELQKILNLEPVKQVVEKMKQALINKILRQIQLNVSKLGER